VLPLLYLHGLATGDFVPAGEAFFGSPAGLSAAAIGRLLAAWQTDYQPSASVTCPTGTTCASGPTASTSECGWSGPGCAVWWSWACGLMAPRSWSRSPTASASPPTAGRSDYATSAGAACAPVVAVGDGALGLVAALRGVSPRPATSATGSTSWPMSLAACVSPHRAPRLIGGDRRRRRRGPQVRQECGQADASIARSTPCGAAARLPEGPVGTVALCLPCYSR
jgi:hypothetical protein